MLATSRDGPGARGRSRDALIGRVLDGRYRLERKLGEGGMGAVYQARHVVIDKGVAVKLLHEELGRHESLVQRFAQEARAAARIGHPGIVDVTDFGRQDGRAFLVMELLRGVTLSDELRAGGALGLRRVVEIAAQVCGALQAAHDKQIVHRDLKPENVFLCRDREGRDLVKVLDFGVAKILDGPRVTAAGAVFGSVEYMSPEQAAGREVDHRADVYALGVMLFQMLTGQVPFSAETMIGTLAEHMHAPPPRLRAVAPSLRLPDAIEEVVLRALRKNPDERFQSMRELETALVAASGVGAARVEVHAEQRSATEREGDTVPPPHPVASRVVAFLVGVALAAGAAWIVRARLGERAAPRAAVVAKMAIARSAAAVQATASASTSTLASTFPSTSTSASTSTSTSPSTSPNREPNPVIVKVTAPARRVVSRPAPRRAGPQPPKVNDLPPLPASPPAWPPPGESRPLGELKNPFAAGP